MICRDLTAALNFLTVACTHVYYICTKEKNVICGLLLKKQCILSLSAQGLRRRGGAVGCRLDLWAMRKENDVMMRVRSVVGRMRFSSLYTLKEGQGVSTFLLGFPVCFFILALYHSWWLEALPWTHWHSVEVSTIIHIMSRQGGPQICSLGKSCIGVNDIINFKAGITLNLFHIKN